MPYQETQNQGKGSTHPPQHVQPISAAIPHQADQLSVEQPEHEQFSHEHEAVIEQQLTTSPSSTQVLADLFADESPLKKPKLKYVYQFNSTIILHLH